MGYLSTPSADPEKAATAVRAVDDLRGYLADVVLPGLGSREDGALTGLRSLDPDSATALFTQLLTGGIDPVASCLGTALTEVLGAGERIRVDRGTVGAVVEEALRYDAPFHFVPRVTTTELRAGERLLPAGARVVLVIAAANRDPAAHPDPDRFDPSRETGPHLSFGHGGHYCLGAALARVVVQEGLLAAVNWADTADPALLEAVRTPSFGTTAWRRIAVGPR
nr:cytochrome P450 [Amycolatopsis umgeniensis]